MKYFFPTNLSEKEGCLRLSPVFSHFVNRRLARHVKSEGAFLIGIDRLDSKSIQVLCLSHEIYLTPFSIRSNFLMFKTEWVGADKY